jgi:hypothetical protein
MPAGVPSRLEGAPLACRGRFLMAGAARYARCTARSAALFTLSRVMGGGFVCTFYGYSYGSTPILLAFSRVMRRRALSCGEAGMGVWGNLEPGRAGNPEGLYVY